MIFLFALLFSANITVSTAEMINTKYTKMISQAVSKYPYKNKHGQKVLMNPALVKAVIYQESRGNPKAKSHAGAYGLTQIMPQTAKLLKCDYSNLGNPKLAIECSTKFLAALLSYNKGDLIKTLSGYNGGTWSTEKRSTHKKGKLAGRIYDNPETKKYVVSVLRWFEWFKKHSKPHSKSVPVKKKSTYRGR